MNNSLEIEFTDINFWLGENFISPRFNVFDEKAQNEIKTNSNERNIKTVFLSSFLSLYHSAKRGNDLISMFLEKSKIPGISLYGTLFFEQENFFKIGDFHKGIIKRYDEGFRMLRLLPKSNKYPYEAGLFKDFYEVLNELKFPLILSLDETDITGDKSIEWNKILDIAQKYEKMPIIIDGADSKELLYSSYLLALLRNSSNIHIETHNLLAFNQIEDLAEFAGAGRLIYGSYYPFFSASISSSRIVNCGLGSSDKQKIASLNMEKILNEINL